MNMQCTNCGGSFDAHPYLQFYKCPYCTSALYLDIKGTVLHLLLNPHCDHNHDTLYRLINRWLSDKEIFTSFEISSIMKLLLPFWLVRDSKGVEHLFPATSRIVIWDDSIHLPSGEYKPFDISIIPSEYELVSPDIDLTSALSPRPYMTTMFIDSDMQRQGRLIHLPFYELEYCLGGKQYSVMMDVNNEQILTDTIPAGAGRIISATFTTLIIALFIFFTLLSSLAPDPTGRLLLLILGLPPAYLLVQRVLDVWRI